jgi:hypothetical protein
MLPRREMVRILSDLFYCDIYILQHHTKSIHEFKHLFMEIICYNKKECPFWYIIQ